MTSFIVNIDGEELLFLREKALYWPAQEALMLSDLHAGKAAHFRRHGIPLSSDHLLSDLNIIGELVARWKPKHLWILGDLFHTDHNDENALVLQWMEDLPLSCLLVEGNHDRHSVNGYGLERTDRLDVGPFSLRHEPQPNDGRFQINGHLHPGFGISRAKQHLRMPAFYRDKERLILPAFGSLTGMKNMPKRRGARFVLVGPDGLIPLD